MIHFMHLVHDHLYDKDYIKVLEDDIKSTLRGVGDNYFRHMDLTVRENIELLYECCGISYGFHGYRFNIFQDYDGYGNIVYPTEL